MSESGEIKPGTLVKVIKRGFTFDVSGGMITDKSGIGIVISTEIEKEEVVFLNIFFPSVGLCKNIPITIIEHLK